MIKPLHLGSLELPNNLLLAPMAGITNLPQRLLAREQGASLCFTEMVSVNGLVRDGKKSFTLLESIPEDRPLGIQLFGDEPEMLAEAARMVEGYGDLIDINMGCPVRKVVNSGAGSALLKHPGKVRLIVRAVRQVTRLPLTIKIRTGWGADSVNFLEIGKIAEEEGCDAVTLHPRTRAQMFEGQADWSQLTELKNALHIPVIGSGDLFRGEDVMNMLQETGCDGVMVARGGLGNPWLFRDVLALQDGQAPVVASMGERLAVARRHLEFFVQFAGERVAVLEMRKHLCWYARGVPGAAQFRALVNQLDQKEQMLAAMAGFFGAVS
jgi:nifR3 family TIM-barrel protein